MDSHGNRSGSTFDNGFAVTDKSDIGVNFKKHPSRFNKKRFEFGNFHVYFLAYPSLLTS
jgi:hypothetical protein